MAWYGRNREKWTAYLTNLKKTDARYARMALKASLKGHHDLAIEDYDRLLVEQAGVCALCERPPKPGKRLVVDHCHATGRIRGLLCYACNTGIGLLQDDVAFLRKVICYIAKEEEQ